MAYMAGHFFAFFDAAAGTTGNHADGTGTAVFSLDAMAGGLTFKAIAFHDAGKALALAGAEDINKFYFPKKIDGQLIPDFLGGLLLQGDFTHEGFEKVVEHENKEHG